MKKEYFTILNEAVAEYEEKKSKFIGSIKPVKSEEEAIEFINSLKSKYWDATHNVYAYYLGGDVQTQRYSDDGEPSGTAGLPVLEAIRRQNLQDMVIVVTRYFGGTLLGAAGLVRAYGKSASLAIEEAKIIKRMLCREISITVEYTMFGKVQSALLNDNHIIKDTIYTQDVELRVYVPIDGVEALKNDMIEITNANCIMEDMDKVYITLDMNGKLLDY